MAALIYQIFISSALVSQSVYHLFCTTRNHLKSPRDYAAKPFHPPPAAPRHRFLRYLHLDLIITGLFFALLHQLLISSLADPLLKGRTPVHFFTSLQSAAIIVCFILLAVALVLSDATSLLPLPVDQFFALCSALFFLQYSLSSSSAAVQTSDLQAKCRSRYHQIIYRLHGALVFFSSHLISYLGQNKWIGLWLVIGLGCGGRLVWIIVLGCGTQKFRYHCCIQKPLIV